MSRPRLTGCRPSASLAGSIASQRGLVVEAGRKRELHDERVDGRVLVEVCDGREHFGLRRGRGQLEVERLDPDIGRVGSLASDVRRAVGVVADEDRAEPGSDAAFAECLDPLAQLLLHVIEERVAVEEDRRHQWKKWRSPVNTIASPSSSAVSMIAPSPRPPPGWMTAATPAAAAASTPSGNG